MAINNPWRSGSKHEAADIIDLPEGGSGPHTHEQDDIIDLIDDLAAKVDDNDSRLSDARTPLTHSHVASDITGTAVLTNDARLSDARTPLAHNHTGVYEPADANIQIHLAAAHAPATAEQNVNADWNAGSGDAQILNKPSTFAPSAHATAHQNGGADEISVAGLSGLLADGQTPLTHDILTAHNGFPGGTSTFLRADGSFAAPPGGVAGDADMPGTGSLTVETAKYHHTPGRYVLTTTQRLTVQGTGRLHVSVRL